MPRALLLSMLMLSAVAVKAQGVGINNPAPDASALLDLTSNTKGLLLPRMTTVHRDEIATPATSLVIYNTTNARFEYFDGTAWVPLVSGGTLDQAYDFGGAGAGRTIVADAGAVRINSNGGLLVMGGLGLGGPAIEVGGQGVRMFFNPAKAAFRAGAVGSLQWNEANIGNYSFGTNLNTTASATYSSAFGFNTVASGEAAMVMGVLSQATGSRALAHGQQNIAPGYGEVVLGIGATTYTPSATGATQFTAANAADRLFVVGNAVDANSNNSVDAAERSDALTILKSGKTFVGNGVPKADDWATFSKLVIGSNGADNDVTLRASGTDIPAINILRSTGTMAAPTVLAANNEIGSLRFWNYDGIGPFDGYNFAGRIVSFTTATGPSMSLGITPAPIMTLTSGSRVGIGTTTPQEKLDVAGRLLLTDGFSATNAAIVYRNTTDYLFLGPQSGSSTNGGAIAMYGSANNVGGNPNGVDLNVPGGSVRFQHTNGNFIFRTTSTSGYTATAELNDVGLQFGHNSTGRDINFVNGNGERLRITPTGSNLTAGGSWGVLSDRRVKSDVRTIDYGLKEVLAMRPVRYFHHDTKGFAHVPGERSEKGRVDIGFIAQDLYAVVPEVVVRPADEQATLWAVSYERLVPVLVKAVQEQQAQIEALRTELQQLRGGQ